MIILFIHSNNYSLIKEKLNPKKKTQSWRKYAIFFILLLGFLDFSLTYYFVDTYKTWQPDRLFEDMEMNPILITLWNTFGLKLGMLIGMLILLPIQYFIAKKVWIGLVILFGGFLLFIMYNHYINITLLHELMKLHP